LDDEAQKKCHPQPEKKNPNPNRTETGETGAYFLPFFYTDLRSIEKASFECDETALESGARTSPSVRSSRLRPRAYEVSSERKKKITFVVDRAPSLRARRSVPPRVVQMLFFTSRRSVTR